MQRIVGNKSKAMLGLAAAAAAVLVPGAALAQGAGNSGAGRMTAPLIGNADIERFRQTLDMRIRDEQLKRVDGKAYDVSKAENKAIRNVQRAVQKNQLQEAMSALAAAKGTVTSNDAKLVLAALELQIGGMANDAKLQSQAVDALLASGAMPATELPMLYRNQGSFAVSNGDLAKAEAAYMRLVEVSPSDPEAFAMLAQTKNEVNKPREALTYLQKAIALKSAARQEVPATWTRAVEAMKHNMSLQ